MRRNAITSDDMLHMAVAAVAGVGIGIVIAKAKAPAVTISGLRGLGAYFVDPVNIPFSGLGSNYVRMR
jgi:hypothetical protein